MSRVTVTEALTSRQSVRVFSKEPVSRDLMCEILNLAGKTPSGGNVQPCKVYALAGEAKERLVKAVAERAMSNPTGDHPDIPIYPPGLGEPWRTRRSDCGEAMYQTLGISRDDKQSRFQQAARNLVFFDAPVGLIVTMDRSLCETQILDTGLFVQSILLLAEERGLATCPQASWTMWSGVIREVLDLDDKEMIMLGISLGYAAENEPINSINQPRLALDEFASLDGF